ncbi:MAG: YebC/PmpR family DNA-binding transcriptional regulator [Longimicrobiales bacterium]
MSGHNKWSQIKRKKGVADAKRGALFTKLIREITVAAREGGGSPESNSRLRLAIDTARSASMPSENIERAVKRGTGELEGVNYESVTYEGYGPGGVALLIDCLTDNTNRTVSDVRFALHHFEGSLGSGGSVAWQFDKRGQLVVDALRHAEEAVFEVAIEAGAEDVASVPGEHIVTTDVAKFHAVREALEGAGIQIVSAELTRIPKTEVAVAGKDAAMLMRLIEALEDIDDVQKVYSNADIDDAILASIG